MKTALIHGLAAGALTMTLTAHSTPPARDADPWLWLEQVHDEQALAWVRERNAATRLQLQAWPDFGATRERILALALNGGITSTIPLTMKDTWGPRWGEVALGALIEV